MEVRKMIRLRVARVTSNDEWPLLYLPKPAIEYLDLKKGRKVNVYLDPERKELIIKPLEEGETRGRTDD